MRNIFWLLIALLLIGCTEAAASPPANVSLLQLAEQPESSMEGLVDGTLTNVAGCVGLESADATYTLIWPPDYDLTGSNVVLNGQTVATLGETTAVSGGEPPSELVATLSTSCQAPFWLVGNVQ